METNLYIIKERKIEGNVITHIIELNPNHSIYNGHFPGQPVLPGVYSLQIVKECLQDAINKEVAFSSIKECKFLSPIIPNSSTLFTINTRSEERRVGKEC